MKIKISALLAIVVLAVAFTACRSNKGNVTERNICDVIGSYEAGSSFNQLADSYQTWTDVSMPVKMELTAPSRLSASGKATMVRDKSVHMIFRKLGFAVAEVYADNDSVIVIVKPLRAAFSESMARLKDITGLTLGDLQSAFMGQCFAPGNGTITSGDNKLFVVSSEAETTDADVWTWTLRPRRANAECIFTALTPVIGESTAPYLKSLEIDAAGGIEFTYSNYQQTTAGAIAGRVDGKAAYGNKAIQAGLRWTCDDARWNTGVKNERPEIPTSYHRYTTTELLKLLRSFTL